MPRAFIPAQLRDLTGGAAQIDVEAKTVRDVIDQLEAQFPGIKARLCKGEELAPTLQISIDHRMTGRGMAAKVAANSEVHFLPVLGGG